MEEQPTDHSDRELGLQLSAGTYRKMSLLLAGFSKELSTLSLLHSKIQTLLLMLNVIRVKKKKTKKHTKKPQRRTTTKTKNTKKKPQTKLTGLGKKNEIQFSNASFKPDTSVFFPSTSTYYMLI